MADVGYIRVCFHSSVTCFTQSTNNLPPCGGFQRFFPSDNLYRFRVFFHEGCLYALYLFECLIRKPMAVKILGIMRVLMPSQMLFLPTAMAVKNFKICVNLALQSISFPIV